MRKRIQVWVTEETLQALESWVRQANEGFEAGRISCGDVIDELALHAKIDLKVLQSKHTSVRKSLRLLAIQKDIDLDAAIRALTDLRSKTKKAVRGANEPEVNG